MKAKTKIMKNRAACIIALFIFSLFPLGQFYHVSFSKKIFADLQAATNNTVIYEVVSSSMNPTLEIGDRVVCDKDYYKSNAIRRGDIIVYMPPGQKGKKYIHRCVALEGDHFSLKDGHVLIDGKTINEEYTRRQTGYIPFSKVKIENKIIPQGHIIVLGDNRTNAADSRYFGPLLMSRITGKIIRIYSSRGADKVVKLNTL